MFFHENLKANNFKKTVYLLASTILGLLLSFLVHAFIEINYLNLAAKNNLTIAFSRGCALPVGLNASLWVLGALGGFFLGRSWWRKIYIEKVWAQNRK